MQALIDWFLSFPGVRERLIELGWTPPVQQDLLGGGGGPQEP